jgi:RNA polymerase sigma-70 factor, ECF subfamily
LTSSHDAITNGGIPLDRQTFDVLYSAAYEDLRQLARSVKYSRPPSTLTPSTLVQEAWLRLAKSPKLAQYTETQFKFIAAQAMFDILVEAARRRSTRKRGGEKIFVTFDDALDAPDACSRDILALRDALDELEHRNHRQGEMVRARFFGGLESTEIASLLGVSKSAVDRDWRAARAWLKAEMRRTR